MYIYSEITQVLTVLLDGVDIFSYMHLNKLIFKHRLYIYRSKPK